MILVDSNILMYAAGRPDPHQRPCAVFLEQVLRGFVPGVIDTEVLQELLHRYASIRNLPKGLQAYDEARVLFPDALAVTTEVMDRARSLMGSHDFLSARDAVHAAVVQVYQLDAICSFDRDFDGIPGLRRIEP